MRSGKPEKLRITLDTNILVEYWKKQDKMSVVEILLEKSKNGEVDLVVTRRIEDDIPMPKLSERIKNLSDLGVSQIGSVTRLGHWVLGVDMLGSEEFLSVTDELHQEADSNNRKFPDWRDLDHIHAHFLQHRDYFLTWDKEILKLREAFRERLGLIIMSPDDFLTSMN
jgi:predicted nucleic acid-binding protein